MNSPCYCSTLRAAARKATALYDAALAPAGVNVAQYGLLRRIERRGSVSLTELGRLAELDRSTVGRNARVLERLGLVRLAAARDQREAAVSLTEKGVETLRIARPMWEDAQLRVEAALGAGGAETLRALAATL
jgi:DNA-binding MarR family transcriptional regulator